jgi:hypothetical protein
MSTTAAIAERRVKIETLRATLTEPEPIDDPKAVLDRMVGPLVALGNGDPKAVRSALRAIGVSRLVFTPQADGSWLGEGFAEPGLKVEKGSGGSGVAPPDLQTVAKKRAGAPSVPAIL